MQDESVSAVLYQRHAEGGDGSRWPDRKGAGTGDRFAMYFMGRACEFDLGVSKDRAEAMQ